MLKEKKKKTTQNQSQGFVSLFGLVWFWVVAFFFFLNKKEGQPE